MRNFTLSLVSLALLSSPIAFATPVTPAPGHYVFTGEVTIAQLQVRETVYAMTAAGKQRLAELRAEHWICHAMPVQGSVFQCTSFQTPSAAETQSVQAAATERLMQLHATFGPPTAPPAGSSPAQPSDRYEEWQIFQNVTINGRHFEDYRVTRFDQLVKIWVGDAQTDEFYNWIVLDAHSLEVPLTLTRGHGQVIRSYFVLGQLNGDAGSN